MKNIFTLIPAYKPDKKIISLAKDLLNLNLKNILIIRDGGGKEYDSTFQELEALGCKIISHKQNLGKGAALKTGFNYINDIESAKGVVTADADGQHLPQDILKIAQKIEEKESALILGVRKFEEDVPLRSKFGNILTQKIFYILTGKKISDTQTGLRGIPKKYLNDFIKIEGEQYEYEMNMLTSTKKLKIDIIETPITTVYIDNNSSSHFNPIIDSIKIYSSLLKFALSGIISFVFDYSLFVLIMSSSGNLALASYSSRGCSLILNFLLNKKIVFNHSGNKIATFAKYLATCFFSISASYASLFIISKYSDFSIYISKIFIEIALFLLNFYIQKNFIFKKKN